MCFQTVSHSEEGLESSHVRRNNELNHQEEDGPLVALAPDASLPEEHSTATTCASACPLFQHLDEVWPHEYEWVIITLGNGFESVAGRIDVTFDSTRGRIKCHGFD